MLFTHSIAQSRNSDNHGQSSRKWGVFLLCPLQPMDGTCADAIWPPGAPGRRLPQHVELGPSGGFTASLIDDMGVSSNGGSPKP